MDINKALGYIFESIEKNHRHKWYDRTVEVAKFCKQIMTGKGQDELIVQVKNRESNELKEQRIRLTNSYTGIVGNQVKSIFKKVKRTDAVKSVFETEKSAEILENISKFNGEQNYQDWIHEQCLETNFYDPNTFVLFERSDKRDDEGAIIDISMYPVVFPSEQVYDFSYKNGNLQYLFVCQTQQKEVEPTRKENDNLVINSIKKSTQEKQIYYLYSATYHIKIESLEKDEVAPEGSESKKIKQKQYAYRVFEPLNTKIQCIRLGFTLDPETNFETCVSPLYYAENVLLDLIRDKSYLDITKTLHTFLQKYVYTERCDFVHEEWGECSQGCCGGIEEQICPKCHGTGNMLHTSDQEVVAINFPEGESPVPLSNLSHYVTLPHETVQFQRDELDKAMRLVVTAIFNTEILETPQLANTATASIIEYEKIYDVLLPFANKISEVWKLGLNVFCDYLGVKQRIIEHQFPLDFKMKRLGELVLEYENAVNAGLSYETLWSIECDIIAKQYANDKTILKSVKAKNIFIPFKDKTEAEKAFILLNRSETDFDRVLYENSSRIFSEIDAEIYENQDVSFGERPYSQQKRLIIDKVNQLIESIKYKGVAQIEEL